jgi:signal peptidase II
MSLRPTTKRSREIAQLGLWFGLAGITIILDQYSKAWVSSRLYFGEVRALTGYMNLALVGNPGAAFSFLADAGGWQRWFLTLLGLIFSGVIIGMLVYQRRNQRLCCALALLLGGALGNVLDRIRWGYVLDFIDLHLWGWHWPVFNLADSAITVAALSLLLSEIQFSRQAKR